MTRVRWRAASPFAPAPAHPGRRPAGSGPVQGLPQRAAAAADLPPPRAARPGRFAAPPHKTSTVSPAAPGASAHQPPAAWCSQARRATAVSWGTAINFAGEGGVKTGRARRKAPRAPCAPARRRRGHRQSRGNRRANIGGVLSRPRAAGVKPFPAPPRAPAWPA